jgi:hypothetical protein
VFEDFLLERLHHGSHGLGAFVNAAFETDLVEHLVASFPADAFQVVQVVVFFVEGVALLDQLAE